MYKYMLVLWWIIGSVGLLGGCSQMKHASWASSPTTTPETIQSTATPLPPLVIDIFAVTPMPPEQAAFPQKLYFPAIDLTMTVEPMSWGLDPYDPSRTRWLMPTNGVGWHPNSVGVGATGNLLISGHQLQGNAPFAPLVLGRVKNSDLIEVEDSENQRFVYQVIEVSKPLPIKEMSPEDRRQAQAYVASSTEPRMTLISGWPDFTTTHRLFIVAQLVGKK